MFVRPSKPGLIVLDEYGRKIPKDGKNVKSKSFYYRLVKDGDLVIMKQKVKEQKHVSGSE